ncbi:MAG: iron ABC transporter [Elusimicrobia bacterium CG08_land_8_20_14_0_20_51_18]|nr:MAG: iron ABC transporter [Elusimicrobia bacterium CG08_land_8_20_14_0_20_51_18]
MKKNKYVYVFLFLFLALPALSLFVGEYSSRDIILHLRLPRVIQALIAGFALAFSGTLLQSVLKNPLADPFIIGTSSGAMLAVILCQLAGIRQSNPVFYVLVSAGGFLATLLSYYIARIDKKILNSSMLLAGIAVNSFVSAIIMLFVIFQRDNIISFFHFTFGSFNNFNPYVIAFSSLLIFSAFAASLLLRRYMDILAFDEEKAATLGINNEKIKFVFFALASAATSAAVAMSGIIGFVGLIVPNIARILCGASAASLLLVSAFAGGALVVFADTLSRTVMAPIELPVGIITAFLGAPFFVWLLKKEKNFR